MRLTELIDDACHRWPERTAFRVPATDETWTYARVRAESDTIACGLQRAGFGPGQAVAVLSPNSPAAFITQLGILKSGAAYVPLNAKAALDDWVAVADGARATGLLYGSAMVGHGDHLRQRLADLRVIRSIGPATHDLPVEAWFAEHRDQTPALVRDEREDPCWIIGSGGTTGTPKAVGIPNRAMLTQTLALVAHMPDSLPVQIVSAPLTHAAGALTYPVLLQGGETVVFDGARPAELLQAIPRFRATRIFMPPTGIYAMLSEPGVRDHDYSSLTYFLYGAAPMSPTKLREAMQVFGPVMAQFYGQAEAPTICTWFSPREHVAAIAEGRLDRLESCGRPSAVVAIRVVDKQGDPLPVGDTGEIAVRSELKMLGYLNTPAESSKLELADGYMRTGDVGHFDQDGYLYISDRARDLIITGGFNVFPSEVEKVISAHPSVQDCTVIGLPDAYWGEQVTAVVEVKNGSTASAEELIALCRARLGPVKSPKQIIFRDLPRSAVGKILKRELLAQHAAAQP